MQNFVHMWAIMLRRFNRISANNTPTAAARLGVGDGTTATAANKQQQFEPAAATAFKVSAAVTVAAAAKWPANSTNSS